MEFAEGGSMKPCKGWQNCKGTHPLLCRDQGCAISNKPREGADSPATVTPAGQRLARQVGHTQGPRVDEAAECLRLMVRDIENRSLALPGEDSVLCAIDKQILSRARKACGIKTTSPP